MSLMATGFTDPSVCCLVWFADKHPRRTNLLVTAVVVLSNRSQTDDLKALTLNTATLEWWLRECR